jgi:hypothetical protein
MPFREKSAWITLITVLLCSGLYFGAFATDRIIRFSISAFHYALVCIILLIILQVVLHFLAGYLSPRDARAPLDERERMFEIRARAVGYYVLMTWMFGLIFAVHFPAVRKIDVVFIAMLGMVVATIAVAVTQIIQFRRGS